MRMETANLQANKSQLRIIGGKWRSRKIDFLPLNGVRPTADRIRETCFNWLMPKIFEANCLDLFAGSGALGFEALSRGAKHVLMIDKSIKMVEQLLTNAKLLGADHLDLICATVPEEFSQTIPKQLFDIVFLDPPFRQNLIVPCLEALQNLGYLAPDAWIYFEAEKEFELNAVLPQGFIIIRQKISGQVQYGLLRVRSPN